MPWQLAKTTFLSYFTNPSGNNSAASASTEASNPMPFEIKKQRTLGSVSSRLNGATPARGLGPCTQLSLRSVGKLIG